MIESFLGTMFLCIIIISLALSLIQYIGIKVNTKTYESEITYIGDYVQSIIIFLAISSLGLLIYVYIYFNNMKSSAWYDSGLLFIVYSAVTGFIINIIYSVIMNIIKFFDKTKSTYFLKDYEKNWTWILVMLAYQIYYLCNQLYTYGFAYLALILSYFFWMNPTKLAFEEKISEVKSLTRSYWCCFVFIIICGFASIRYSSFPYSIAAIVGIILGFIIGIFLMTCISKKMKKTDEIKKL